ncbi:MAG: ElyC/SanA/YdcF family protein [Bacteroidota bacterium]
MFKKIVRYIKLKKKPLLITIGVVFLLLISLTFTLDYTVKNYSEPYLYEDVNQIPFNNVAVLLGTSKYVKGGGKNFYFQYRIEAAALLYHSQKCRFIIISGDNSHQSYDEPAMMKAELLKAGVPDSAIYLDYAGFRTFDSMIRAKMVFGQNRFTIISQKFHNERAVYIARHYDMDAIGFNAQEVTAFSGFKTKVREKIARVKLFIDFLFDKQPKFLGKPIEIK